MFTSLQSNLGFFVAVLAFQSEDLFLGCLCVLSEDRFGLTAISPQLHMISSLTKSFLVSFTSLVLSHLMLGVLLAFIILTEGSTHLGDIHHRPY